MTASHHRFDPTVNYYAILDVPVDASRAEIVSTYRRLMRRTHPDLAESAAERAAAEERAKRLNAAYAVLSRPKVRKEYDQAMRRRLMAQTVLDRYSKPTPNRPIRPTPAGQPRRARRQPPSTATRHAQRRAYQRSLWQLIFAFGGICIGLVLLIVILSIAAAGVQVIF